MPTPSRGQGTQTWSLYPEWGSRMKVVLAEKPSVARDLAAYLKAKSRHEGYFEGNGYQVTWSYGHLVGLKEPEEYDPTWKSWKLETLPIVPESFQLKTLNERGGEQQF